jgi:hypothetical protein
MVRAAGLRRDEWLLSSKLWLEAFGADGFRPSSRTPCSASGPARIW